MSRMWAIMGPCLSTGKLSTLSGAPPRPDRLAPSPRGGAKKKPCEGHFQNTHNTLPHSHLVIQHVRGVGRHTALHQLGELVDVHPPPAEPLEHTRATPDRWDDDDQMLMKTMISPVRVLAVIPGSARPDPDYGRPVVYVRGQGGVQLPVLLSDPPTLNSHLQSCLRT